MKMAQVQWKTLTRVLKRELPGIVIRGRWRIGEQLDEGGMGIVFLCSELAAASSDDHVIKFIQQDQMQEALDALQLKHEYLIPTVAANVHDFQSQDGQQSERLLFIVMPKAKASLRDFLNDNDVYGIEVPWIIADICKGLEYLHSQPGSPLIHRDLKPENILWFNDHWTISDWGIMRTGSYVDTVYATAWGSRGYEPPEYFEQQLGDQVPIKPSWDVYQLGLITLELLTGNLWKQKNQDLPEGYPELRKYIEEIRYICTGCLHRKPEERISVSDVLALAEASKDKYIKQDEVDNPPVIVFADDDPHIPSGGSALPDVGQSIIVFTDDDSHGQYSAIPPIEITRVGYHLYALCSGQKCPRPKNDAMREALHNGSAVYATNLGRLRILEYDHRSSIFALWESGALDFDIGTYRTTSGSSVGDHINDLDDAHRLIYGILPMDQIREDQRLRRLWL